MCFTNEVVGDIILDSLELNVQIGTVDKFYLAIAMMKKRVGAKHLSDHLDCCNKNFCYLILIFEIQENARVRKKVKRMKIPNA